LKNYANIDFKRFVYTLHDLFRILSVNGFRIETLFIADSQGDNANNYGVLENSTLKVITLGAATVAL
jgi:hypothetical protein